MMNNWRKVWKSKQIDPRLPSVLSQLIAADGFHGMGGISEINWRNFVQQVTFKLGIKPKDSIFEVGCGAGAFLYPFYEQGFKVAGIDYAKNQVHSFRSTMPTADIQVGEARNIAVTPQFDVVISSGVFFYFPDHAYAAETLRKMVRKARKSLAILDVPDLAKKEKALKLRKKAMGKTEYDRLYDGLEHLYYPQEWFGEILSNEHLEITVENQCIPSYQHNSYRFNVFIWFR